MTTFIKKIIIALLVCIGYCCFGHPSAKLHYEDFKTIFNGYGDEVFEELSYKVSSGIDNELPTAFRQQFGKIPGNHRILGHGWTLNDSIPRETLELLSKEYPGKEKEIIKLWQIFARNLQSEAVRITGLPKAQANAFASLLYDIHLLGDLEPGNKMLEYVLSSDDIVSNINKNVDILFRNKPEYAALIKRRLSDVAKRGGKDPQIVAQRIMTELYDLRMGDMLKTTWGKTLKSHYSIDRAIAANTKRVARPIAKIAGIRKVGKTATDFTKRLGVKFVRGILQEHVVNGKTVTTLSVPISPAIKVAGAAGVMTLVFTEGVTVYKFANGTITEEDFIRESAKNCGASIVVGTATYVLVALGATPTGWVIIGAGITAELVYEVAFEVIDKEFATPLITMDDIIGRLPTEIQQRRGAFNDSGYKSFLEANQARLSSLEFADTKESPFEYGNNNSALDYFENKKSPLEIGD